MGSWVGPAVIKIRLTILGASSAFVAGLITAERVLDGANFLQRGGFGSFLDRLAR